MTFLDIKQRMVRIDWALWILVSLVVIGGSLWVFDYLVKYKMVDNLNLSMAQMLDTHKTFFKQQEVIRQAVELNRELLNALVEQVEINTATMEAMRAMSSQGARHTACDTAVMLKEFREDFKVPISHQMVEDRCPKKDLEALLKAKTANKPAKR